MGITSFKSTTPSSENTSLCTRDDVTMVDECKQNTTTPSSHMSKNFQMNTLHDGLKREWVYTVTVYVQGIIWSVRFQSIKQDMTIESGNPRGDRDAI